MQLNCITKKPKVTTENTDFETSSTGKNGDRSSQNYISNLKHYLLAIAK